MIPGHKIYIGTSGWSYRHWRSIFYPEKLPIRSWLSFYSGQFAATEINTSFYQLPKPETLKNWISAVPRGFLFCPKISRYITHMKKLNDPVESLPRFFDLFAPVKKRLGPILIQLPSMVAFHAEKAEFFFSTLRSHYKGYRYALEIRHNSWMDPAAIAILKKYRIAWVIAESGNRWPYAEIITDKNIYIRFHGPDGSYGTSYSKSVMKQYAKKCLDWAKKGHTLWIFFNNDIHGYAVENARTLIGLINKM